jgi:hypothetical protein
MVKKTDSLTVLESLISDDELSWANWLIVRVMERKQCLAYAIFSAEQVLDIFEKRHPEDKRPRKAVEAARAVLKNDTPENRAYAADAADAAADAYAAAADAAYAAADAAYAAAYADADAAAADAAADTAADAYAADAAADDDVRKEMQIKILNYGIKLLKGGFKT